MTRKEKRNYILSLILGDGSLHRKDLNGYSYGCITLDHGMAQADYVTWKADLVAEVIGKKVNVRSGHKGKSIQFSATWNRLKAWRKFCYPNGKKSIAKILPFLTNPDFALAIWLMDDGYVEPSINKLADGSRQMYGAAFRLFTCDQSPADQQAIMEWLDVHFAANSKIRYQFKRSANIRYPFVKIDQASSLAIWKRIRDLVLQFDSMKHKFRHIEELYQRKLSQRTPS